MASIYESLVELGKLDSRGAFIGGSNRASKYGIPIKVGRAQENLLAIPNDITIDRVTPSTVKRAIKQREKELSMGRMRTSNIDLTMKIESLENQIKNASMTISQGKEKIQRGRNQAGHNNSGQRKQAINQNWYGSKRKSIKRISTTKKE